MRTCDHWREPCGYCPTCHAVTGDPPQRPPLLQYTRCGPAELPLDESGDAAVLAQAKRDQAEASRHHDAILPESLLGFAKMRNKVRADAIKAGDLARVLASDMKLDSTLSDAEDAVHATMLKAGIADDKAEIVTMMVSTFGRMFLGAPPSMHRMLSAIVTPTPEAQAARRERIMDLARVLYQIYGSARGWRRAYDLSLMRRWSTSDTISEGEPKIFGGAASYATDDGSSAGALERNAWHAVAQAAFDYNGAAMHGRGPVLDTPALARVLYQAYSEHLGGRSSYATHEQLDPWVGESEERAWKMVAKHAKETLS